MRITRRQLRRIIREQIDDVRQGELDLQLGDETATYKRGTRVYSTGNFGEPMEGYVEVVHSNPTRYTVAWVDDWGDVFARDVVGPDEIQLPEEWELS